VPPGRFLHRRVAAHPQLDPVGDPVAGVAPQALHAAHHLAGQPLLPQLVGERGIERGHHAAVGPDHHVAARLPVHHQVVGREHVPLAVHLDRHRLARLEPGHRVRG